MSKITSEKINLKSKKRANLYVKMTAKNPVLFIALVLISIIFILTISLNTRLDIMKTYKAEWDGSGFVLDDAIPTLSGNIYAYENRNEKVYIIPISQVNIQYNKAKNSNMSNENDSTDSTYISINNTPVSFNSAEVMLDVPVGTETLFTRVFLHGGTNE